MDESEAAELKKKTSGPYREPVRSLELEDDWDKLIMSVRANKRDYVEIARRIGAILYGNLALIVYTSLSVFTRLYRIGANNSVVWDEAHFGKFGAYYLNRTFYFDVHPPLGKMLVGLAGALSGFDGSFEFDSGAVYPDHVPFRTMRILMAIPGILLVPLAWGTACELGMSRFSRHLVTLMVLCDTALLVISRFILLDSMLIFFTLTTVFFLAMFHNQRAFPFDEEWWLTLLLTGISIGCVASIKWVGLFVTALVGLYTIWDLWDKFGDLRMPIRAYIRHWAARIVCLIFVPLFVYMFCFKIHFIILNETGPGDAQMSSLFQAHLEGNDFMSNPVEVAFGSRATFKNMGYGGGLLHSHIQTFPVGSEQQQVTCYHYKDTNNEWVITPRWEDSELPEFSPDAPDIRYLKDGDIVRLVHFETGRNLHSHNIKAPVTKTDLEVSGYGNATIGDSNDYWIVEVVDDISRGKKSRFERIHTLSTRLRFRHFHLNCYLRAANEMLPQWGFKQIETTCSPEGVDNPKDPHSMWNVENHYNDRIPLSSENRLRSSPFLHDFWHLNVAMLTSNNALTPDEDKDDTISSSPSEWPWLWNGMRMNGWGDDNVKYYLVGNPVVWWGSSFSLIVFVVALFLHLARAQRKYNDFASPAEWENYLYVAYIGFGGWFLHYLPFLIMGRVTYLHHYLPTLYFAILLFAFLLDQYIFFSPRFTPRFKALSFFVFAFAIVGTFLLFKDCAFGITGSAGAYSKWRRWRSSWNLY